MGKYSRFAPSQPFIKTTSLPLDRKEVFDRSGGWDTYSANEVISDTHSPYLYNVRTIQRGRIKTRKGPGYYSVPMGETLDTTQTSTTGAANQTVSQSSRRAAKYVATGSGRLTRVDLNLSNTASGTGPLRVDVYSNNAGAPGTLLSSSATKSTNITGSLTYVTFYFHNPALISAAATYWIVAYIQDDGANSYNWSSTTSATTTLTSTNSGNSWAATTYAMNFKAYVATNSAVLGLHRRYMSTGTKTTLIAHGTTLNTVNDITGVTTAIKTGLSASATDYYFADTTDTTYYVNGYDAPRQYDGTTESALGGGPSIATNIILHKNRLFFVTASDPTKIYFSDTGAFSTFQSTSFLYIPTPKSGDPITGWAVLQDNLVIWTRKSKYVLYGSDLASFTLRRSTGVKGAVNQNVIKVNANHAYFLSDDGVYKFNGTTDIPISQLIQPSIDAIDDKTKACAEIQDNKYRLYNTNAGFAWNNQCFVYDILYDSWYPDTNRFVRRTCTFSGPGDTGQLIEGSSLVGAAWYGDVDYADLGAPIDMEWRSKYDSFGHPSAPKQIKRWYPQLAAQDTNYNVIAQYDKDFGNSPVDVPIPVKATGATWGGGFTWGGGTKWGKGALIRPRIPIPGDSRYIQTRYKRSGSYTPVEIIGDEFYYRLKRPR